MDSQDISVVCRTEGYRNSSENFWLISVAGLRITYETGNLNMLREDTEKNPVYVVNIFLIKRSKSCLAESTWTSNLNLTLVPKIVACEIVEWYSLGRK